MRTTTSVFLTVDTWLGEQLEAASTRYDRDPSSPVPSKVTAVTAGAACAPK